MNQIVQVLLIHVSIYIQLKISVHKHYRMLKTLYLESSLPVSIDRALLTLFIYYFICLVYASTCNWVRCATQICLFFQINEYIYILQNVPCKCIEGLK